ncbi:hypothetical protein C8R45DRAFT_1054444 [Mycena sanguinolenta]|nr:hypothetical protein C8R45DRAFT_1054444 [Mycena sanguinolenta]
MLTWAEHQEEYLDEMLRLEGRGYPAIHSMCGGCSVVDPKFHCCQQTCYGPSLYCGQCVVDRHAVLPTPWIEEWNGAFFERRSLKELGLVIQLGHPPGITCPNPLRANKAFVLIDLTGVHNVAVNFCQCDGNLEKRQQLMRVRWWPATVRDPQTCATFGTVRLFQILNCQGKVSAHDFLRSLELLTNNDGLHSLPDRRHAFCHIVQQWRMTLMMKRAGRGHDPGGVKGTRQGELALQCRACPQDGKNLPDGWDRINWNAMPEDLRYKYFLFLAQDSAKDPILGDGYGYFVHNAKYTEFLRDYVTEEEISSCAGFQAMFLANKKRIKGLRTTGVGGVTCARHNMWLPNGLGDLQLGERYCNMDFILFSALIHIIIFYLILSYDIACQYGINFWSRMEKLPEEMKLQIEATRVWFKVPNFHLPPHRPACHSAYSFHYMWGAGRTHAETIEQNWEFSNGAAASTKMMGMGTRASTLEDLFGFHNWRRLFPARMAENVKEGQVHRDAFEAFDQALQQQDSALVESWKTGVHAWESRQHTNGVESPFEYTEKVMSMRDIKLKLAKDELLRSGEGTEVEREDTPSTFILMGMEIEESQRYLTIDVKAVANPTEKQTVNFLKWCVALLKRIRAFRKLQRAYMPNIRKYLTATQHTQWDSESDRNAEGIRLFLPSDISSRVNREKACVVGLAEVEADLRVGEACEALNALRQGLRTCTMTNRFRLRNCTGQRMLKRGQGVLRQVNLKVHKAKLRHRYARNPLLRLRGNGAWEKELRVLEDDDGGIAAYGVVALGEGRRTLLWIWYAAKTGEPTEAELVEALRVEWCKAYARTRRWHEDVVLVEEEMRRTIEYGHWLAGEWNEGLAAYTQEQAHREEETCRILMKWWAGVREKGRAYLAHETALGVEVVIPVDEDDAAEHDDEEGAPDYEDEGDDEIMD